MHVRQGRGRIRGGGDGVAPAAGLPAGAAPVARELKGAVAYYGGRAAEDQIAAHYESAGCAIVARRWRGRAGEIDLIAREGTTLVFIEVKRARTIAIAAERLSERQMRRILSAAAEYLSGEPAGQDSDMRFDVALVDGCGRVEIRGNVVCP